MHKRDFSIETQMRHMDIKIYRLKAENARLRQLVKDTVDDMECLETCDSYGHDNLCPVTHPEQAWRKLREENARLSEQISKLQSELWYKRAAECQTIDRLKQREAELEKENACLQTFKKMILMDPEELRAEIDKCEDGIGTLLREAGVDLSTALKGGE